LSVRLFGQLADGIFQASLAGTVLFNPERQANAADIAAGFAVILLPYSVLGPFVGVLLDRWWRQRVLFGANLIRAALVCLVALEIATGIGGEAFYISALVVTSVNRFVLSGLSASLPHVIESERLITANALSTTTGTVIASVGGGLAIGLRELSGGGGNVSYAFIALSSAAAYVLAGLCATGFQREQLGPDDDTRNHGESVHNVVAGLVAGARHVRSHPSVVRAFAVIGVHRFAYGVSVISTLLLYRNYFVDDGPFRAGLGGLGQLLLAGAAGGGLAAVVTPIATRRFGYTRWAATMLLAAGVIEWTLGLPFTLQTILPASALLGFVAQAVKITVDTLIAQRVDDNFRGRVFSIYDTLFNLAFVSAAVLTALVLPENGRSSVAVLAIGAAYALAGAAYLLSPDTDPALQPPS
jgi:MFS family permease